jgi:hypothetical protein
MAWREIPVPYSRHWLQNTRFIPSAEQKYPGGGQEDPSQSSCGVSGWCMVRSYGVSEGINGV